MSAIIVVDLGFGDAGKGTTVDFLSRRNSKPPLNIRFNGGAQAAHNVVTPTGNHHTFSQFGAGSFVSGVNTFLSDYMLVDPLAMINEANHLRQMGLNPYPSLFVDQDAMVVTPYHKLVNRAREIQRGDGRHGSTGMGIGEAQGLHESHPEMTLYVRDLRGASLTKLSMIRDWLLDMYPSVEKECTADDLLDIRERMVDVASRFTIVDEYWLPKQADKGIDFIFEAAQGVLLDQTFGFFPYVTRSTTTFENALNLLDEMGYCEPVHKLGVLRAYMTRHGAGPFPTESAILTELLPERHNSHGEWQGAFRVGQFDAVLGRYAIEVCGGVDSLALTNLDRISPERVRGHLTPCMRYQHDGDKTLESIPVIEYPTLAAQRGLGHFLTLCKPLTPYLEDELSAAEYADYIAGLLNTPISIRSYGPTAVDKEVSRDILIA